MTKSQLRTASGTLILFAILWSDPTMRLVFVGAGFLCLLVSWIVTGSSTTARSTPRTIIRLPTSYEQRRSGGWSLGLGLIWGFIPFVIVQRR